MRISSRVARRSFFVVTILILLGAVLIGPTKAVSGKVGKRVQDLLASVMGDDTPPAEQPHLDGVDVSNGPQFDISSVLNFQNAGGSGPAIQGNGGQGTTPGSNGNGSQSNNNDTSNNSNGSGGSFGPRGFAPGHVGGSFGSGGSGGGVGGVGPAALKTENTSDQQNQDDTSDQGGQASSGPQGTNPSNGGPGNSDGSGAPPSLPGNGGSSSDGPSASGPNGPTGGNGPVPPKSPDSVTGPDSSNPGTDNPPAPHTNTLRQTEENLNAVPEPSSLLLLAFGVYAHAARRRRNRTENN